MKLFLLVLCIFSVFCTLSEELSVPMYCSGDSGLTPPYDDLVEFYKKSQNLDETELIQQLREIIHFPLNYWVFEEGVVRQISSEKFEEFVTGIYGRQLIQHFYTGSQEKHKNVHELKIHFTCDQRNNRYGIQSLSFVRHPEEESLMDLFQDMFIPFVSSAQTKYLLSDKDLNCM